MPESFLTRPFFAFTLRYGLFRGRHRFWFRGLGFLGLSGVILTGGCQKSTSEHAAAFIPNTGQIQILNGCGKSGAAEIFRDFLTGYGFDVIEFGNAPSWNYRQTLVIARSPSDRIADDLAKVLGVAHPIHLQHEAALVEATVIIGKDYEELMRKWPHPKPSRT